MGGRQTRRGEGRPRAGSREEVLESARPAPGPWWEEGGVSQGGLFRGTLGL